jgi:hypothetical protein
MGEDARPVKRPARDRRATGYTLASVVGTGFVSQHSQGRAIITGRAANGADTAAIRA